MGLGCGGCGLDLQSMSRWLQGLVPKFKFQFWLGFVHGGGSGALWFGCLVSFSLGIGFCLDLGLNRQSWWWVMRLGCSMGGDGGLFGFWLWILAFVWVLGLGLSLNQWLW